MPDTRSTTEAIAALTKTVEELSARQKATEAQQQTFVTTQQQLFMTQQAEVRAQHEARFDRTMDVLEKMHIQGADDQRAEKQPMDSDSTARNSAPLLSTPPHPLHAGGGSRQQVIMAYSDGAGSQADGLMLHTSKPLRIEVPVFSGEAAVEDWLFQMDRYFTHNYVPADQRMTIATFYMAGEALRWYQWLYATHRVSSDWFHFSHDVLARFGPSHAKVMINKLHQTSTVAVYIREFESLSTRTPGLSPENLLNRFLAGLKEEVHREIVLLCPRTLAKAMGLARVAEQKVNESRWYPGRPPGGRLSLPMGSRSNPAVLQSPRPANTLPSLPAKRLTPAEMAARRELGLFFNCDKKFVPGHRYKPKFQCLIIEEALEEEEEEEVEGAAEEPQESEEVTEVMLSISYHAMQGHNVPQALRLEGVLSGRKVVVLIDGGSTHNFVQTRVAKKAGLVVEATKHLSVTVGNGEELRCEERSRGVPLTLGGHVFHVDFHLLPIYGADAVLGVQWLAQVGPVTFDYQNLWLSLEHEETLIKLHGLGTKAQLAFEESGIEDDLIQLQDDEFRHKAEFEAAERKSVCCLSLLRLLCILPDSSNKAEDERQVGIFGTGLTNDTGENNCFLNVIIQSLWHIKSFREELLMSAASEHIHTGEPCVLCALLKIFSSLSIASMDRKGEAVAPTELRIALSNCYPDSNFFQEAQMNDASEVLDAIFDCLHQSFTFQLGVSDTELKESNCRGSWDCSRKACIAHSIFGMNILERMNCQSCQLESRHMKYTSFFHHINASALRTMKVTRTNDSFDELLNLVEMNHQVTCDPESGGCGHLNYIHHVLSTPPHVFTTVLGWQKTHEAPMDIKMTLAALCTKIDVAVIYQVRDQKNKHFLVSVVCYYGQHYICFAHGNDHQQWVMYDDQTVKVIGSWEDVVTLCERGHLQPQILFFESVTENTP